MVTRREALVGIAATGAMTVLGWNGRKVAAQSEIPMPKTPVKFAVPSNACDTHVHVFGDPQRYPYAPTATFHHPPFTADQMRAFQRALGLERLVIVHSNNYGTDHRVSLDALKDLGNRARCVLELAANTSDAELDRLYALGVRGSRMDPSPTPAETRQRFTAMAKRLSGSNWHINTLIRGVPMVAELRDVFAQSPVPIVLDHFAFAQTAAGVQQPGFDVLIDLLKNGNVYLKLSRAGSGMSKLPDYADVAPLAKALIAANPQRVLWGSDWPHSGGPRRSNPADITPYAQIDDGHVLNQLAVWAPDDATRKQILVDNPAKLYGF